MLLFAYPPRLPHVGNTYSNRLRRRKEEDDNGDEYDGEECDYEASQVIPGGCSSAEHIFLHATTTFTTASVSCPTPRRRRGAT